MKRSGVMLYFSLRSALNYLNDEQLGQLLRAILDYAEYDEIPDFPDPLLAMAWSFVVSGIDRDWEAYQIKTEKKRYAAFCREALRQRKDEPAYDDWKAMTDEERKRYLGCGRSCDII